MLRAHVARHVTRVHRLRSRVAVCGPEIQISNLQSQNRAHCSESERAIRNYWRIHISKHWTENSNIRQNAKTQAEARKWLSSSARLPQHDACHAESEVNVRFGLMSDEAAEISAERTDHEKRDAGTVPPANDAVPCRSVLLIEFLRRQAWNNNTTEQSARL